MPVVPLLSHLFAKLANKLAKITRFFLTLVSSPPTYLTSFEAFLQFVID